ncbi:Two-component sensor histidine kinase, contains HisKA and HATPase domains [Arboricoccus pini]|uniref:histidine kinase n=1 Tax=Arboricoccus pini TaxID=1963835 RepID=A0A212Q9F1_9PROT|nr:histidine kinase dimerization/phosphoacceptor domain -containing protein [Arboricoccus pini]SNB55983.1 Two-component sensor histidine kinase, contains HisKA and HATPase domains [Arboricoccus pini]
MIDSYAGQVRRVLFIDDDEGLRRLVTKDLQRHHCEVIAVGDALEGMRLIKEQAFDVIVLDHIMPNQDGIATLEVLKDFADPPPAIYLTGSDEARIAVAALKAGAVDYVIKDVGGNFLPLLRRAIDLAIQQSAFRRAHEAAQQAVREARDRAEALLSEVNHRVANSLQLVSSLVRLQASGVADPAAHHVLQETEHRILAIAQVHKRLYSSGDVRFVDAADYLGPLVEELAASLETQSVTSSIMPIRLPTDMAISLGVIVSELVTNAAKYAYPQGEAGAIRVTLDRMADEALRLVVEDEGVGYSPDAPARGSGMGTRIVRTMAGSIEATIDIASSEAGTKVQLIFPLESPGPSEI